MNMRNCIVNYNWQILNTSITQLINNVTTIILLNLISIPFFKSIYTKTFPIPIVITALTILNCLFLLFNFRNTIKSAKLNISNFNILVILIFTIFSIFNRPFYTDIANLIYSFSFLFIMINFQKHGLILLNHVSRITFFSLLSYFLLKEGLLNQNEIFFNVNKNVFSSFILLFNILIIINCLINDKVKNFELAIILLSFLPLYLNQSRIAIILYGITFISLPIKNYIKITIFIVSLIIAIAISVSSLKKNQLQAIILFYLIFQKK